MPKIICARCKAIEDVKTLPEPGTTVLCTNCRLQGHKGPARKIKSIPRKQHGTRVMLPITCSECGEKDTLDYVPKGAALDEVLCRSCALKAFGPDSDWARVVRYKEKDAKKEYEFSCDECGRTDYLPFEPREDRTYLCNLCRFDHDTPSKDRLAGREKTAGGVFIRRRIKPERD